MDEAVKLYCDILGFDIKERSPGWTVIATKLGELTLCKTHVVTPLVLGETSETPLSIHVHNFKETALLLEKAGYSVHRASRNSGTLTDPWGNLVGLHDHIKASTRQIIKRD